MSIFDILSPVAANPKMAAQVGSPLLSALLMKHGGGGGGDGPPPVAPPQADSPVGPQLGNPGENAASAVSALPSMAGGDGGGIAPVPDFLEHGMDPIKAALAANAAKPRGFFDRIGDFLHSDEGRAALLRSGAATLNGGLGAGIQAGADFVDHRRHERAATAAADADRDERGREFDENHAFHLGQLDVTREQNRETAEHYRRGDINEDRRIDADLYKHDTPSGDTRLQSHTSILNHLRPSGDTIANNRERHFEHLTPSGDTTTTQEGENYRHDNPPPAPVNQPRLSLHTHYTTTPEEFARNGPRLKPSQVQPDQAGGAKQISGDAEYDALPSGARFMGPDGKVRIKP